MAENSHISWTDHTFNPWMGCTKVSPACQHCYAERDMDHRYGKVAWGPQGTRVKTSKANWQKPLKWNRDYQKLREQWSEYVAEKDLAAPPSPPPRPRVFCASLADVFEDWPNGIVNHEGNQGWTDGIGPWFGDEKPSETARPMTMDDLRRDLFALIDATPHLDWLLLTKRPENIRRMMPGRAGRTSQLRPFRRPNVWLGCSVESQEWAEKRIPELLRCRDLARFLFLSCEPLLDEVHLDGVSIGGASTDNESLNALTGDQYYVYTDDPLASPVFATGPSVDWVITGGESGPNARPSHPDWFRDLRDQCQAAGVPFHFKQWGEYGPSEVVPCNEMGVAKIGVKKAGRILDGREWLEFPERANQCGT